MKQFVCNYAPVRFLPYRETGEFVNVGVVIHCPQADFFGFRLVPLRKTARVTNFFPELDTKLFKAALQGIARDLDRIQAQHRILTVTEEIPPALAKAQIADFCQLVRRREGLLHFGELGVLMAATPEKAADELFGRFVERQFAQKREYQEIVMRNRLAQFLKDWKLARHYDVNQKIGDSDFHIVMPFVHYTGESVSKAIKPLDLAKAEPSEIYHHGGAWVKNMERLRNRHQMPQEVIFTVKLPEPGKRLNAANEICDELRVLGVELVPFEDTQRVRSAVEIAEAA
jgi:hypothetical protein